MEHSISLLVVNGQITYVHNKPAPPCTAHNYLSLSVCLCSGSISASPISLPLSSSHFSLSISVSKIEVNLGFHLNRVQLVLGKKTNPKFFFLLKLSSQASAGKIFLILGYFHNLTT